MKNPLINKASITSSVFSKTFYCIGYGRKSTEELDTQSIKNQEMTIFDEFQRLSLEDTANKYVYLDYFSDEDYTGTNTIRPDFQHVLELITTGKANMLIVCDLSRLSRNMEDSIHFVQGLFVTMQLRFVSISLPSIDSYKSPDSIYNIEVPIQSIFNENFSKETSVKVRKKFETLKNNGCYIGAFAPYGWIKDADNKHKLVADDYAHSVMHKIKDWILEGQSASQVAINLNQEGILSPGAYEKANGSKHSYGRFKNPMIYWSSEKVKALLLRPANVGTLVQGRQRNMSYKDKRKVITSPSEWSIKENAIPPIFTIEEQTEIIDRLGKRTRVIKRKEKKVYMFSGFLKCADCGRSVTYKSTHSGVDKDGKPYIYEQYVCNNYRKNKLACTPHRMGSKELEDAVLAVIQQQIYLALDVEEVVKKSKQKISAPVNENQKSHTIELLRKEESKIMKYKKSLYEDLKDELLDKNDYLALKQEYGMKEIELQESINRLLTEQENIDQCRPENNAFLKHFSKHKNITTLTREILGDLVDHILVGNDKRITIIFKYQDEYKNMLTLLQENGIL